MSLLPELRVEDIMRYEGVYHEVEWESEPKQREMDIVSRLRTERFSSLK